ncbi:MAG: NADH-quinone oxidoreductase subunit M [Bdellovibrio sp.]|nr:NADH-quinone oxidoreductase subunit M [Bdellovibrio sp.]
MAGSHPAPPRPSLTKLFKNTKKLIKLFYALQERIMSDHIISFITFTPLFGALVFTVSNFFEQKHIEKDIKKHLKKYNDTLASLVSIGATLLPLTLLVYWIFGAKTGLIQLPTMETTKWIDSFSMNYEVGIDGFNILPALLIVVLFPVLMAFEKDKGINFRGIASLLLILETSLLGALFSQNLFLLFFFWMFSSVPLCFLIGLWGGNERGDAAFKTMIYSSVGNALFFAALILIYHYSLDSLAPPSFSFGALQNNHLRDKTFTFFGRELNVSRLAFWLLCVGLVLRAPLWPAHSWFLRISEQAKSTVFITFPAVVFPVLMCIFIRVSYQIFPQTLYEASRLIFIAGGLSSIFGVLGALTQTEIRKIIAYLCLSEFGLIVLGFASFNEMAVVGIILQMFSFGISIGGLGILLGIFLDRVVDHNNPKRPEEGISGLVHVVPWFSLMFAFFICSLLGFPGFSGFIGNSLILFGSFSRYLWSLVLLGFILLFFMYCLFSIYRRIFFGEALGFNKNVFDLSSKEKAYLIPLVGTSLLLGVYPKPLLELIKPTVMQYMAQVLK